MGAASVEFEAVELEKKIEAYRRAVSVDRDVEQRFTLMSKLFSRALTIEPGEERFL